MTSDPRGFRISSIQISLTSEKKTIHSHRISSSILIATRLFCSSLVVLTRSSIFPKYAQIPDAYTGTNKYVCQRTNTRCSNGSLEYLCIWIAYTVIYSVVHAIFSPLISHCSMVESILTCSIFTFPVFLGSRERENTRGVEIIQIFFSINLQFTKFFATLKK